MANLFGPRFFRCNVNPTRKDTTMNSQLAAMLLGAQQQEQDEPSRPLPEAAALTLQELYADMMRVVPLEPGMLVSFKHGFDPRHPADYEQPALLVDVAQVGDAYLLKHSTFNQYSGKSAYGEAVPWNETALIMILDRDGDARLTNVDLRRLVPWTPPAGAVAALQGADLN